jgi:hypothetical protein
VNLQRLAGECALDEARNDVPVLTRLARADGVEEANDHAAETALVPERQREELVERLRVRVGPALRRRRTVDPQRVLVEGNVLGVVPVHLRARGDQHRLLETGAVLEHVLGALHVRQQCPAGLLDDQAHSHSGCQVIDRVATVHKLADDGRGEHRVDDEVEALALAELDNIRLCARREVVEGEDLPALVEQELGQVRADEAGAAGDQGAHRVNPNDGESVPSSRPFA